MAGPHDVLGRLPGIETVFVAEQAGPITNDFGSMTLVANSLEAAPNPDIVLVPGGPGHREQLDDGPLHGWLREVDKTTSWTTSVCTGSLILAACGLLENRRATTHWLKFPELERLGATPVHERVVIDDKYLTAAGVSAGIDMALRLAGMVAGDHFAQMLQLGIEYAPEPPYAGTPEAAPDAVVADLIEHFGEIFQTR
jgi:transcriptional regulator GlxA family with amidase domain